MTQRDDRTIGFEEQGSSFEPLLSPESKQKRKLKVDQAEYETLGNEIEAF